MKRARIVAGCALLASALAPAAASAQLARRSVECPGCIGNYYYFDQNASSGAHRDWNCGASSYDGHRGSDWSLTGGLGAIDAGNNVVAVAAGTVVTTNDGAFDRCTSCPSSGTCGTSVGFGYGNYVRIDHGTRSVIYAHMRTGSVRVRVGDRVTCGQALGQIASSGCSTGAHLHTEFRAVGGTSTTAYDPYTGMCSPTRPSVWTQQNAYRTLPGTTCDGSTPPPVCPTGTFAIWTCNASRTQRTRCIDGMVMTEPCPAGCMGRPAGTDDVCNPPMSMCSAGVTAEWACNSGRDARVRCNAGRDETQACPFGCTVNAGDDLCSSAPMCPAGVTAEWTCTTDGSMRRRCVMGAVQSEPCASGCEMRAGDDGCRPAQRTDSGVGPMPDVTEQDTGSQIPAPDAGSSDGGAPQPFDAGSGLRDGGLGDARRPGADAGPASVDGGCGCRVGSSTRIRADARLLAMLTAAAALVARRRRSASQR
ncbi:MAG: M23 family metallopeptidase [Deltaproteobacteria bacterium]|nr:M23 family metallopeptidase [Deltaproteobacteria bacterium]